MPEITQVTLPGVGVRHEFTSSTGQRVAVVSHRTGRRELSVYRPDDPDACSTVLELEPDDAATLSTILHAPHLATAVTAMQEIPGLIIDWLTVKADTRATRGTIGEGQYRGRTGASIVAVIRGRETIAAPGPEFALAPGDVVVAVGTPDHVAELRSLLGT